MQPETGRPDISVIIPTHNRADQITQTLDALAKQTFPAARFEVIVVADGCVDDTAGVVRGYGAPFRLHLVEQPGSGPALARNAGAAHADGRLLLFMDDDIEAAPRMIEAHVSTHQGEQDRVIIGYLPTRLYVRKGYFRASLRRAWEDVFNRLREPGHRFCYTDLLTGNFSVGRALFNSLGGFDASLRCHEDWEFGYRLIKAQAQFAFAEDAEGWHHERTAMERSFKRKMQEGIADVQLGMLHPELRPVLHLAKLKAACHTTHRKAGPRAFALVHRLTRDVALRWPTMGDRIALRGQRVLDVFERLRIRYRWRMLLEGLLVYWYWRGIGQHLASVAAVEKFLAGAVYDEIEALPTVDIEPGLHVAAEWMDRERPNGVRILYGNHLLGFIKPEAGAERLRGVHLRAALAKELSYPLTQVLRTVGTLGASAMAPRPEPKSVSPPPAPAKKSGGFTLLQPILVAEYDLSKPAGRLSIGERYAGTRILVRNGRQPIGWMWIDGGRSMSLGEQELRAEVTRQLGGVPSDAGLPEADAPPLSPISVVVCTRDRPESLSRCLESLVNLDYPDYEVVVVDNASRSGETSRVAAAAGPCVRCVREDRPGLDWARNRGIKEARHDIIAYTDDDARVDRGWLRAVAAAFASPDVMAVTGNVAPAELETEAQILFELVYGGMGQGLRQKRYVGGKTSPRDLLWASGFGVGANMAFRRSVFDAVGLFDIALDVGTPSCGGGDVEMFHRIVARGYTLVYEPEMLVWHYHRPGMNDLRRLVVNNGRSFGAYLLTCIRNRTVGIGAVARFVAASWIGGWIMPRLLRPAGFPRALVLAELGGAVQSPIAYYRSRAYARRVAAAFTTERGLV